MRPKPRGRTPVACGDRPLNQLRGQTRSPVALSCHLQVVPGFVGGCAWGTDIPMAIRAHNVYAGSINSILFPNGSNTYTRLKPSRGSSVVGGCPADRQRSARAASPLTRKAG